GRRGRRFLVAGFDPPDEHGRSFDIADREVLELGEGLEVRAEVRLDPHHAIERDAEREGPVDVVTDGRSDQRGPSVEFGRERLLERPNHVRPKAGHADEDDQRDPDHQAAGQDLGPALGVRLHRGADHGSRRGTAPPCWRARSVGRKRSTTTTISAPNAAAATPPPTSSRAPIAAAARSSSVVGYSAKIAPTG